MGSAARVDAPPRFRVRAVGSFKQQPGCPEFSVASLSPERLEHLCRGECYNPSDERHRITRLEIVRIRPQDSPDEAVEQLIEDPWKRFDCGPDPAGCAIEFEDPEFTRGPASSSSVAGHDERRKDEPQVVEQREHR